MYNNLFFSNRLSRTDSPSFTSIEEDTKILWPRRISSTFTRLFRYIYIYALKTNRKFRITESTLPIQSYDRKPVRCLISHRTIPSLCPLLAKRLNSQHRSITYLSDPYVGYQGPRHFQRFEFGSGTGTNGVCHEKREGNVSLARERPFHRLDSCSGLCISVRGRDLTRRGEPLPSTRIRPTPWRISRRVPNLTASLFHPSRKRRPAFVFGC